MTHAEFELELVEALNMLLEDERASVEMEVALASGATEYSEREALSSMGADDIQFCEQLREEMERAGLAVTPQINGIVFQVIGAERYDDRLRAFAHHQREVAERARELQESNLDGVLRDALEGIAQSHDRHAQWTEQRANEFAETRLLEFGSVAHNPASAIEQVAGEVDFIRDEQTTHSDDSFTAPGERAAPADESAAQIADVAVEMPSIRLDSAPEDTAEVAETPADVAEPSAAKPKTRATSRARSSASSAKAASGATTATKAAAKPNSTTSATRRTRRAPSDGESA